MHIHVNGTRLWFDTEGPSLVPDGPAMRERPTVILLHGGPGSFDHSYFKPDFGRLAEVAQVVYLDLRGHGRSDWGDPLAWRFETCADDIPAFCEALGISKPIVHGHSLGGFVAVAYGTRHPGHAGALVLDSTCARFVPERLVENFRRIAGDEVAEIAERVYVRQQPVTPEEWARCWKLFGRNVVGPEEKARTVLHVALNAPGLKLMGTFDVVNQLGRIESPTLICVGETDPATPVAVAREILEGLTPGIGRLEIIKGAGHFPWRDAPSLYWPIVKQFVTTATAGAGTTTATSSR
jgi:pimeloyl-ACP methyl ester carboxylesterase